MRSAILIFALSALACKTDAQTLQSVTDNGSTTSNRISINTGNEGLALLGNSYLSFKNAGNSSRIGYMQHDGENLVINADVGNVRFINNVGIGIINPIYKLDVGGEARVATTIITNSNSPFSNSSVLYSQGGFNNMFGVDGTWTSKYFGMKTDGTFVAMGGNVGVGTSTPDAKLTVAGNIHAKELKISVAAGADFVFNEDYKLLQLDSIERFVKLKNHLPGIPSAHEMKSSGLEVGDFQIKLLQKIEELTLHLIELNKRNNENEQKLKNQEKQNMERLKQQDEKIKMLTNLLNKKGKM